ncbi:hypothetical protein EDC04DRAFT_2601832 [Pisolithus marmoratus]|nr:hypothetical protein EDC04DRAFT_2601832 [Pisolithus marmoratus]
MFGKALLLTATLLLFHAACMTYDRQYLAFSIFKSRRISSESPRNNLRHTYLSTILALVLGILGASMNSPPLKNITWARTIDEMDARPGLANYVSRGKLFHDLRGASRPA